MMSGRARPSEVQQLHTRRLASTPMARPTFDTPFHFFTSVTHNRLTVFRTHKFADLLCASLNEARMSSGMKFFSYVIMPEHFHIITDGSRSPSDSLRYLNGITARRIIDHLKENGPVESLEKLRLQTKDANYKYSLWQHHSDKFLITSESMLMQKVRYIHNNPIEGELVDLAENYRYSSARYWLRKSLYEDEPIEMDLSDLEWRR